MAIADPTSHAAFQAWSRIRPDTPRPLSVKSLKGGSHDVGTRHTQVFRLKGVGPDGSTVIAKLCPSRTGFIESLVYSSILPSLDLSSPRFFGSLPFGEGGKTWLFLEDVGDTPYSPTDPDEMLFVARWLGMLHARAVDLDALGRLPDRSARHYLNCLDLARHRIEAARPNSCLTPEDHEFLDHVDSRLADIRENWDVVRTVCDAVQATFSHSDFLPKNVRISGPDSDRRLAVLDWEYAGRGFPGVDLACSGVASSPGLMKAYLEEAWPVWGSRSSAVACRGARVGWLLRHLALIEWKCHSLRIGDSYKLTKIVACLTEYLRAMRPLSREVSHLFG